MATSAQVRANRKNAAKSTGPKTKERKEKSAANAITFGLFSKKILNWDDDEQEFTSLRDGLIRSHMPQNMAELLLVELMAMTYWKLRRVEAEVDHCSTCHDVPMLESLSRAEQRMQNTIFRTLHEFETLQTTRRENGVRDLECPYLPEVPAPEPIAVSSPEPTGDCQNTNVKNEPNLYTDGDKYASDNHLHGGNTIASSRHDAKMPDPLSSTSPTRGVSAVTD